jgi:isocitrate dehydrogenase kinase/phosphatase
MRARADREMIRDKEFRDYQSQLRQLLTRVLKQQQTATDWQRRCKGIGKITCAVAQQWPTEAAMSAGLNPT